MLYSLNEKKKTASLKDGSKRRKNGKRPSFSIFASFLFDYCPYNKAEPVPVEKK